MDPKEEIVTTGIWFYDKKFPKKIVVYTVEAKYSSARYTEDEELDDAIPIPQTPNGLIYKTNCGGEEHTLVAIKKWANEQPWGPVKWADDTN